MSIQSAPVRGPALAPALQHGISRGGTVTLAVPTTLRTIYVRPSAPPTHYSGSIRTVLPTAG